MSSRRSAASTSKPRPPAPIIEAMITMLSDSMITWLTPTISPRRADGTSTRQVIWRRVQPIIRPRSRISVGHAAQRQDGDPHHRRHGVDDGGDDRGDRAEAEQEQDRHQIGEDRHRLHQVEHGAHRPLEAPASGRPAMPSSRPPATPSGTATRIEASVTIALSHWPKTAR